MISLKIGVDSVLFKGIMQGHLLNSEAAFHKVAAILILSNL